ncbi:MAG TPA: glycosyltransferase [Patescibacteria group bacterium]|nr:glycosyltransferase [Patescibacteria group bacterium]
MIKKYFQRLYQRDLLKAYKKFDGVILDNVIGDIPDLQTYFGNLRKVISPNTKVLVSYHNHLWEPVLSLASKMGLRKKVGIQNWLDENDLANILNLSGFEVVTSQKRFFGITTITIAKPKYQNPSIKQDEIRKDTVSIIIPARNEEGNIGKIVPSIPKFGKRQEIIFVEGNSRDKTWEKIEKEKKKRKNVLIFKQRGIGKADAVKLGLSKATGSILIIYDADRTVEAKDLKKFYDVLARGEAEFANGSRLVYPMEKDAMRFLNKIGNQLFGSLFSWILGQRFKDTLCGTKAFFRKDYLKFKFSGTDPFGDFNLIFGAIRNNLKVIEIPVRYKERVYGSTNINRFKHGLLLFKMVFRAFREFKL